MVFSMRHSSQLVCMVWHYYVCIDTIFVSYGYVEIFKKKNKQKKNNYCLVGCLSNTAWTHAVLGVLFACVLYFVLGLAQCS